MDLRKAPDYVICKSEWEIQKNVIKIKNKYGNYQYYFNWNRYKQKIEIIVDDDDYVDKEIDSKNSQK